ncbi:DUF4876 domain-containing protein [Flavobacteriaceae bacterium F08102]|nr:DUF4876 domain-containing protein [Flavobacteriaceae bacterium F08102]
MKTKISLFLMLNVIAFFTSCSSDDNTIKTIQYTITVEYPDNYASVLASDVTINLTNQTTNEVYTGITDATGSVSFDVIPGTYNITASKDLTANETETLTGVAEQVFLNANTPQITIVAEGTQTTLKLEGGAIGDWVIKEFYYAGVPSFYFYDAFIEIYNNSTDVLYADGLLFGSTKAGSSSSTYAFIAAGETDVYLAVMMQIPGDGTQYPVEPGESIVIAIDGIDHKTDPNGNPNSPVNLGPTVADFEVYFDVNPNTPDTDNPDVPNVNILHSYSTTMFDYIPGINGSGLVIFNHENPTELEKFTQPNSTSSSLYVKVPKENIIDGVDAVKNETVTAEYKRLPTNIDAGMTTVGGTFNGTSIRRKIKQEIDNRKVLLDTNNSTNDFEANSNPNPKGW